MERAVGGLLASTLEHMTKYCVLCGKEIRIHEPYHYFGDDTDPNAVRAHDLHIDQQPYRWNEISLSLGEARAGEVTV